MKRQKLINLREKSNLSQKKLSSIIGITRSYYGFIETGRRNPNLTTALKICSYYNKELKELFADLIFFNNKSYDMKLKSTIQDIEEKQSA